MPSTLIHVTGDRIGDALVKWPIVVALKQALPEHHITWIAGQRASVFQGPLQPLVSGVIDEVRSACDIGVSWGELLRPKIDRHYDIVISTEQKLRSALVLKRVPHEIFISPAWGFALSDRRPPRGTRQPQTAFARFARLASLAAGVELQVEAHIAPPRVDTELAAQLIPSGEVYIGLAPGASTPRKCWPLERFINIARTQLGRGRTPVFFLGPAEHAWKPLVERALEHVLIPEIDDNGRRRGGPLLTIALARRMTISVANDSGAGHLLAAGGRPVVSLFGHTSVIKFEPPYGRRIALSARNFGGTDMARIPQIAVERAVEQAIAGQV